MNSLCQWQSVQQSVFKNSLPCIMHLACQQTCWWQHTYTRTHTSWRKEPSLCSEFFFGEQTCNNGAGIQLFVARWVPTPLSQGWLPKMLLHSHHESLKSYTELLSFFFPFLFFFGGGGSWFYHFLHILPLRVYFNHNTRTRFIRHSPMLFKYKASAFILYADYMHLCYN